MLPPVPSNNVLPSPVIFTGAALVIESTDCSGIKAPDHMTLAGERDSLNWHWEVVERCDWETICNKGDIRERKGKEVGKGPCQSTEAPGWSLTDEGGMKEQTKPTQSGITFLQKEIVVGETNEFYHNRDGNTLRGHTEG